MSIFEGNEIIYINTITNYTVIFITTIMLYDIINKLMNKIKNRKIMKKRFYIV